MFEFIKKLFKKDTETTEEKYITLVRVPRVNTEEVEKFGQIVDELPDIDVDDDEDVEALHDALVSVFKRNGWTQKFRDNTTGEIHEVDADDEETFSKMMADGNMTLLLFG